LIAVPTPTALK